MKRLFYFALVVSSIIIFTPVSGHAQQGGGTPQQNQGAISMEKALEILKIASPYFNLDYISLWEKYKLGQCSITVVRPGAYKVEYGGLGLLVLDTIL